MHEVTKVVLSAAAKTTCIAGSSRLEDYSITDFDVVDIWSNVFNNSRGFVTEN